jgi:hypothetical protein
MTQTKQCAGYGTAQPHTEPTSEFGSNKSRPDGLTAYCKRCSAAAQKAWRQAHPEIVKANKKHYRELEKKEHGCGALVIRS